MKSLRLKPREIRLALATGAVALLLGNYLVVGPWFERIRERVQTLHKLRAELAYRQEVLQRAGEWRRDLNRLTQSRESVSPHVASQEAWMKHFESLAGKSGVQLMDRRSAKSEGRETGGPLRVECSLQGSFESVVKFMVELQNDAAHPQVDLFQLSPIKAGEDRLRVQLTVLVALKAPTG